MKNIYEIVDDFQAGSTDIRVLVLDREYAFDAPLKKNVAVIDGKEYEFHFNSIRRWVTIQSKENFTGKTVEFFWKTRIVQ